MPVLSVIVPVYNTEKLLSKCIESLLAQTLKDIELIFVNDCSPDNSIKLLREYEKKHPDIMKVIDSPVNLRQGGARNLGLKIAKGEYVGFVDSDDFVTPTMFEQMYWEAKKGEYDVVGCQYKQVDKDYNEIQEIKVNIPEQVGNLSSDKKRRSLLVRGGSVWSHIYKKALLDDKNILFPEKLFYEDNYFVTMVFMYAGSFGLVDEPLYCYYMRDNSTARATNSNNDFDSLKTFDMIIVDCKKNGKYEEYKEELEYLRIIITYYYLSMNCVTKFKPINYEKLYSLRERMRANSPKYYKNKYYINRISFAGRMLMRLNDISPRLYAPVLSFVWKIRSNQK